MPHKAPEAKRAYARKLYQKQANQKRVRIWAERQNRIDSRATPAAGDCSWAAGLFEGEGTVTLTRGGRIMRVRPLCTVASTDPEVTEFFRSRWGGAVKSRFPTSKTGNCRIVHTWQINAGEAIECFILDLLSHIRTNRVRDKMRIVLDDIRDRKLFEQNAEAYERSEERRKVIRRLNARGLMPDGQTVSEHVRPRIAASYESGSMQPLLPAPKGGAT